MLPLDEIDYQSVTPTKDKVRPYKIGVLVLAACLVVVTLSLGLGLGVQLNHYKNKVAESSQSSSQATPKLPAQSCQGRCNGRIQPASLDCVCDASCEDAGNCCPDYYDLCLLPLTSWECTRIRCGEKRLANSSCHCSDDCVEKKDCCTNYMTTCKGAKTWVAEPCEDLSTPKCPAGFKRQPLILFSLDGFRAEYLQTWSALVPNLQKLRSCGTHAPYMRAMYPTKTFPNHYTITTGMYPESHGIVDNNIYDVKFNAHFSLGNEESVTPKWWGGQPIWNTVTYQGLKSGTYFWPGSDVKINDTYPDYWAKYNTNDPYENRIKVVFQWLDLPEDRRPDFYTLYLDQPDGQGHNFGPVSGQVIEALQDVDRIIGMLMDGLKQRALHQCVNIMIVADHGMDKISCDRVELLDQYMSLNNIYVYEGPYGRIRARNIPQDYYKLDNEGIVKNLTCKKEGQHFKPYLKWNLPKRLHYGDSYRIETIHLFMERQWQVARQYSQNARCNGGTHGFDNEFISMQAIFIGYGPKFKNHTEVEAFENIELYNLMCDILEITPSKNNGTHGSLNHLLRSPFFTPSFPAEQSDPLPCPLTSLTSTNDLGCTWDTTMGEEAVVNQRLNLSAADVQLLEQQHLPLGRPVLTLSLKSYCLLHHKNFVSAYSHDIKSPLWSSYTVRKPANNSPLPDFIEDSVRPDLRLPEGVSANCTSYKATNITYGFLFPPNLVVSDIADGLTTGNIAPMYAEFKKLWNFFHKVLLVKYAVESDGLNVVSGPVFDYNFDGIADKPEEIAEFVEGTGIPIPTHYFVVLTSCKGQPAGNCTGQVVNTAFVLPHRPDNSESCQTGAAQEAWVEERVRTHTARVRDVELLSGLSFYQDPSRDQNQVLRSKTYLHVFETEL
ncbi:venom phosphodiesterase CdcPDE-like isoform X1 [Lampetra fluviatilis]